MTYPEAIDWLYQLRLLGSKLGLENPRKLAALAGNPHQSLKIIHVAGTNGKGSVCAMLESIYRAAGYKTGLYTSPHLVSFRERIQVNRKPIAEAEVVRLTECVQALLRQFPADQPPTFFEVITVMALEHFARERCDIVLLETGLGGRLDATNIATPIASVITPIALDHQQYLGETLAQIAAEKAGIIKQSIPVFSAPQSSEARVVIEKIAAKKNAALTFADTDTVLPPISLPGEHQKQNAALTATTARSLDINETTIRDGLANAHWPARAQLWRDGKRQFLFDAAHNPSSMQTLVDILKSTHADQRPAILLGISGEKNWREMCRLIAPLAGRMMAVPTSSQKTISPVRIAEVCGEFCETETAASAAEGLARLVTEPFVVVAGSIFLVGEVMERLNASPQPETNERGLNEWEMTSGDVSAS